MDELRGTLYDTSCMMAENERMLSEYRDVTHSKSREMDIVRACVCGISMGMMVLVHGSPIFQL